MLSNKSTGVINLDLIQLRFYELEAIVDIVMLELPIHINHWLQFPI